MASSPSLKRRKTGEGEKKQGLVGFVSSPQHLRLVSLLPIHCKREKMVHHLITSCIPTKSLSFVTPHLSSVSFLTTYHSEEYVGKLKEVDTDNFLEEWNENPRRFQKDLDPFGLSDDCRPFRGICAYTCAVVGGTIAAAKALKTHPVAIHWAGGRHHSHPDKASGFCYANDIAFAIFELMDDYERILYIDIDIHAPDAVIDEFYGSQGVTVLSFHHLSPGFFPGVGTIEENGFGEGEGHTINIPLGEGLEDEQMIDIFFSVTSSVVKGYQPQVIVMQCGADGLSGDRLGCWNLTSSSFIKNVETVLSFGLPTLLLGGGGYSDVNVARCWTKITHSVVNFFQKRERKEGGIEREGQGLSPLLSIPDHDFFNEYRDVGFSFHESAGVRRNTNTPTSLSLLKETIAKMIEKTLKDEEEEGDEKEGGEEKEKGE